MGLFSTLASSSGTPQTTSSSQIPTVIQLYTSKPIVLDSVSSKVTGYSAMTYQAVQVGSLQEDEFKNRHQTPDLGIWNCCVYSSGDKKQPLVDSLLTKVAPGGTKNGNGSVRTFCLTVDLSDETLVEPSLTLLQGALVRHLIENPPLEEETENHQTSTTSLYQLQATQFGIASSQEKESSKNISESSKAVKTTLMICAQLPSLETNEVSEQAYKKKQATALIIYHLRKFAAAINASLCFVQIDAPVTQPSSSPTKESQQPPESQPQSRASTTMDAQPTVNYETLSQLWRDLALDQMVWMTDRTTTITTSTSSSTDEPPPETEDDAEHHHHTSTPLYGPGRHQEDLIDTVLLRNANYPGHWDATKDSLWVALPTPSEAPQAAAPAPTGDEGWLGQLRTSIAADVPKPSQEQTDNKKEEKPKEKDAAVSSFFESLLKNP